MTRNPVLAVAAAGWAATAAAATLAALLVSPLAAAAVATVAVAAAAAYRRPEPAADDLARHISAARRRRQRAHVVVFAVPRGHERLVGALRLTDSLAVRRVGGRLECELAVDGDGLDRAALERRIAAVLGVRPRFGWAAFPEDGVTLAALLEAARRDAADVQVSAPLLAIPMSSGVEP